MAENNRPLNEQIFELRYKPNARILDSRGLWADQLSNEFNLFEWRVSENRVDVYDKEELKRVFISYNNSGVVLRYCPSDNEFLEVADKLLRFISRKAPFGNSLVVLRIGVKSRFAHPISDTFERLFEKFKTQVIDIKQPMIQAFKADLIDIAVPLTLSTDSGKIAMNSGPMESKQLRKVFEFENNPPKTAIYFEADYSIMHEDGMSMPIKDIHRLVSKYISENWSRYNDFIEMLK